MRKAKGQARSSDESESEDELEPGAVVLHKMFNRKVVLHADETVVKSGKRLALGEAEALKVAAQAGIPAPRVHEAYSTPEGQGCIRMDYIEGQPLDKLWPDMSDQQKDNIAQQLREVIQKMRSVTPPAYLIGACDGKEIRDTRQYFTYHFPACHDEGAFNDFLLSSLYQNTPPLVRVAVLGDFILIIGLSSHTAILRPEISWLKTGRSRDLSTGGIVDDFQSTGNMLSSSSVLLTRIGNNMQRMFSLSSIMMSWLTVLQFPNGRTLS